MKKWTDENTIVLIKMYEQYPDLWRGNLKFKNSELRMNLWAHIAEVQETTVEEVQKKIKNLKIKFSTECKRHNKNPAEYFESKPWKFFNQFKFLMAENEPKSSSGSAFSESLMSESNCSSKQFGTEDNSAAPSKLQDESRDFESSMNFDEDDDDEDDYDNDEGPRSKKKSETGQDAALVDALHCIKTLLDESEKRDEHSIYGEHIAQKIRTCNRNNTDIAIAQHHIENIIFNLAMGVYNQEGAAALEDKTSLAIPSYIPPAAGPNTQAFQPFVIPKPDPETNS